MSFFVLLILANSYECPLHAHGFNANSVKMVYLPNGFYRVVIKYTHIPIGEYREAHADFKKHSEASKFARDLINGADFFLGKITTSVHFHKDENKPNPF